MPPAAVIRSLLVFDDKHPLFATYRVAKRIAIGIVGGTILLMGIAMMVLPGPGIAAILAGLGILAIEFAWARIWLKKAKAKAMDVARPFMNKNGANRNGSDKDIT
jgi:uncharacterized protein (TIGR02611 family)